MTTSPPSPPPTAGTRHADRSADASPTLGATGAARHPLDVQCCARCAAWQPLQRFACAACGSDALAWHRVDGAGVVWAITTVHRAPTPSFRALVPYAIAMVELAGGVRRMGHADPTLAIGERVRATTFEHDGALLLRFERA